MAYIISGTSVETLESIQKNTTHSYIQLKFVCLFEQMAAPVRRASVTRIGDNVGRVVAQMNAAAPPQPQSPSPPIAPVYKAVVSPFVPMAPPVGPIRKPAPVPLVVKPTPGNSPYYTEAAAETAKKLIHDGAITRWALMMLFVAAVAGLVCVLQIHNVQTSSTCWSNTVSEMMVVVACFVTIIMLVMVGVTIAYFRAQPKVLGQKRSFGYPPFIFFSFLTIVTLVAWIMIVDVTAKGRAGIANDSTATACLPTTDYNAGIAGAMMALIVAMMGTVGAYHWARK